MKLNINDSSYKKVILSKTIKKSKNKNNNKKLSKTFNFKIIPRFNVMSVLLFIIILIILYIIFRKILVNKNIVNYQLQNTTSSNNSFFQDNKKDYYNERKYDINFKYENYESNIITNKIKKESGWIITEGEANFINGIIRKNKLKNCLEIGVANGGSSILILNAIKDMDNSILVSLDINDKVFNDPTKKVGYRVNEYFPELNKNWKLFTGDQPHKFLVKLNMKFDFLFLDSAHVAPGEIINFIEALPFLNENAIVVIHDLVWHLFKRESIQSKVYPSITPLVPAIYGDKVLLGASNGEVNNIVSVFLYPHQENHYIDYFLILLNSWEYMPLDNQIEDLRIFIKNYYKKNIYLNLFNTAVSHNKKAINRPINYNYYSEEDKSKILVSIGRNNSQL